MPRIIYIALMLGMAFYGILSFSYMTAYDGEKTKLKFKKKGKKLKLLVDDPTEIKEIEKIFNKYGVMIQPKQYSTVRYSFLIMCVVFWLINLSLFGNNSFWGPLGIVMFIASIPKEEIGPIKMPLKVVLNFYSRSFQKKRDLELFNIISQIKNIYITMDGNIGTDYVLTEVLKFSKHTKVIFIKFMTLWNINKRSLAIDYFTEASNSTIGRDLAFLLGKLDNLKKEEILDQLDIYQNTVRQTKETYRLKAQEGKSLFYYIISIGLVLLIIVNMLFVIIFSNLMEQFQYIL